MRVILGVLLLIFVAHAEIKTYTKTIKQTFGGAQTPDDARLSAIKKAEADIAREAGEYISTKTIITNARITHDEITALSAAIVKSKVISEKPYTEGASFGLEITLQASLDTNTIQAQIDKILSSEGSLDTVTALQKQNQELLAKLEALEKQNQAAKTETQKEAVKAGFVAAQEKATAIEWFDKGYQANVAKEHEAAISYYTKVIQIDPNDAKAYNNRGLAYKNLKQTDRAIADYDKAIQIDSNDADAYYNRGIAYYNLKQTDRAISDWTKAIQIDPNDADAYYNRGVAYDNLKQYNRAISDYDKAIQIDPNYAMAYYNRGVAYYFLNNLTYASRDARKACGLGNCKLLEVMSQNGELRD